jgi:hypothetical protein
MEHRADRQSKYYRHDLRISKRLFLCHYWGKMPVKYKGEIDMYFIEGFRPNLSVDGIGSNQIKRLLPV